MDCNLSKKRKKQERLLRNSINKDKAVEYVYDDKLQQVTILYISNFSKKNLRTTQLQFYYLQDFTTSTHSRTLRGFTPSFTI